MKSLVTVGLGLLLSLLATGCCCTPCCNPCGSPCGYGGCGPGGCPAPVGSIPAQSYYTPPCNGSCAY